MPILHDTVFKQRERGGQLTKRVHVICDLCNKEKIIRYGCAKKSLKLHGHTWCVKCSKSQKRIFTEQHKKNMSLSRKNVVMTEETKQKISNFYKGKKTNIPLKYGKDHHCWIEPEKRKKKLKHQIREHFQYKNWRLNVFIRDNRKCVFCGSKKDIQADHIKPFALILKENNITTKEQALECPELWDLNNGRTLCFKCHKNTDTYGNKWFLKINEMENNSCIT